MNNKRALITGINGQDGAYLAEYLIELGYDVFGLIRRHSISENQDARIVHLPVESFYGDLTDPVSLNRIVRDVNPHEIYNLGAMSHVRISFDSPIYAIQTNAVGVINMLEAMRNEAPGARFYQASSSECFGNSIDSDGFQRETTPMIPVSPYGCAKVFGYNIVRHYRAAYNIFAANGTLFNHESPRRGLNFVTQKVVHTACQIKLGNEEKLTLGNIDAARDWGHSYDYVRAMHLILQHDVPDDFCISTGETHTIRDLCNLVFCELGMHYKEYLEYDEKYTRPEELDILRGDCSKAKRILGWKPTYTYESMIKEMIEFKMKELS